VGDALFTSTIHLESYLTSADRVVEAACSKLPNPLISVEVVADIASARSIVSQFARRAWRRPVTQEELDRLFEDAERGSNATLSIDLETQTIQGPDGGTITFEIDPFRKHCLLNGLDDIGLTMQKNKKLDAYEKKLAERAWA
jgi:hypothetical protein